MAKSQAHPAGPMTPAQFNRFVAKGVSPLKLLADGSVRQEEETVGSDMLSMVPNSGGRYGGRWEHPDGPRSIVLLRIRTTFWAGFDPAA